MIVIDNRELLVPKNERYLGTAYDQSSEYRVFQMMRFTAGGVDLSALSFMLDIEYPDGTKDTAVLIKEVNHRSIILKIEIPNAMLRQTGTMFWNVRGSDVNGTVKWASYKAAFYVEDIINTPGSYTGSITALEQYNAMISNVLDSEQERVKAEELRAAAFAEYEERFEEESLNKKTYVLNPRGAWAANVVYIKLDTVTYLGTSYVCRESVASSTTPNNDTSHWQILAQGFNENLIVQTQTNSQMKIPSAALLYSMDQKLQQTNAVTVPVNSEFAEYGSGGTAYYRVKNGWCIVCFWNIHFTENKDAQPYLIPQGGIPNCYGNPPFVLFESNGSTTMCWVTNDGGIRVQAGAVSGKNMYGSVVYPVSSLN